MDGNAGPFGLDVMSRFGILYYSPVLGTHQPNSTSSSLPPKRDCGTKWVKSLNDPYFCMRNCTSSSVEFYLVMVWTKENSNFALLPGPYKCYCYCSRNPPWTHESGVPLQQYVYTLCLVLTTVLYSCVVLSSDSDSDHYISLFLRFRGTISY